MKNGKYILVKAPDNFPGKKYRGKYCLEHHLVYWQANNIIPSNDEIIHHINENTFDNRLENLELLSRKQHSHYHNKQRGRLFVDIKCPNCNKIFSIPFNKCFIQKRSLFTCYSKKCSGSFTAKLKKLPLFDPNTTIIKKYRKNMEP